MHTWKRWKYSTLYIYGLSPLLYFKDIFQSQPCEPNWGVSYRQSALLQTSYVNLDGLLDLVLVFTHLLRRTSTLLDIIACPYLM